MQNLNAFSKTKSDEKDNWATSWPCFNRIQDVLRIKFYLDVCATPATTKCDHFLTKLDNALEVSWFDYICERVFFDRAFKINQAAVWCNPPFSRKAEFLEKTIKESAKGLTICVLLPMDMTTTWWTELVEGHADTVAVPDGRYNFMKPDGKTLTSGVNFSSCFALFTPWGRGNPRYLRFERKLKEYTKAWKESEYQKFKDTVGA